jgi:hypothetical protein
MPPVFFPLYYQLLETYRPVSYSPSTPIMTMIETKISPTPSTVKIKTIVPSYIPPAGGDKTVKIVLLGDSMIDTLSPETCQLSFRQYFPGVNINLLKYGYGSTNIESAKKRLTEITTYRNVTNPSILSQNPDIILIESFAYNNFGNSQSGIDRQTQALRDLTSLIKEQLPDTKIILAATIAPNSIIYGNGIKGIYYSAIEKVEKANTVKLYLQNLVNFASKNNFALADAFHPSLFGQNGLEQLIDSADHLHPSNLGTELFCDTVAKSILTNQFIN